MNNTKLDVIIPVRPNSPRLRSVLESLVHQDFRDWRLIALLDRDCGHNRRVIEEAICKNETCFIECDYQLEGFSAMLNRGLRASNAEYVARQDDDDLSLPGRFTDQIKLLEDDSELVLATGFANVSNSKGEEIGCITQPSLSSCIAHNLIYVNVIPHSSVMLRRKAIIDIGGYNEKIHGCEDYELWLRLLEVGKVGSVGRPVLEILRHDRRMSRKAIPISVICQLNRTRCRAAQITGLRVRHAVVASAQWTVRQLFAQYVARV